MKSTLLKNRVGQEWSVGYQQSVLIELRERVEQSQCLLGPARLTGRRAVLFPISARDGLEVERLPGLAARGYLPFKRLGFV